MRKGISTLLKVMIALVISVVVALLLFTVLEGNTSALSQTTNKSVNGSLGGFF